MTRLMVWLAPVGNSHHLKRRIISLIIIFLALLLLYKSRPYLMSIYAYFLSKANPEKKVITQADYPIYPVITSNQQDSINKAIKITFTGDLILLRDVVENGYNKATGRYDFSSMFQYAKDIWKNDDLSIGVFEGPMVAPTNGYSSSRCDDGIPIHLNFPIEYGRDVKAAGMDLVTISNNHLLDQGPKRYVETMNNLNRIGLPFVGAWRNDKEKREHRVKIVSVRNKRFAVLSYTYNSNNYPASWFLKLENRHITNVLADPDSSYFDVCKQQVENDFAFAKSLKPDAIIVLPHMGTQGTHVPDKYQKVWVKIFADNGADMIFADHPHTVQPIDWLKRSDGGTALVVYCPGNFVNSYTYDDEDESMIVEAYLNPKTAKPFAVSIVPFYAYSNVEGNYIGLPIYKAITEDSVFRKLSRYDYDRISKVHKDITSVALGVELPIDQVQERYFYFRWVGYARNKVKPIYVTHADYKESRVLKAMLNANKITFVGNSLTEGTMNGGYGWYEPLASLFPQKRINRIAKGSMTSKWFCEKRDSIAKNKSDLYIVAIGCNDIRYRDPKRCAMNSTAYIKNIRSLSQAICRANPKSNIIFIAPWQSLRYDPNCQLSYNDRLKLYDDYTIALKKYCLLHGFLFVDPNPYIKEKMESRFKQDWLVDWLHPNAYKGIQLYSEAVIEASK